MEKNRDESVQCLRVTPLAWWMREIASVMLWSFILAKLFVYDFDTYLLEEYAPGFEWVLSYKVFILLGGIAGLWLLLGTNRFIAFVAYALGYLFVILLWRIPRLFIRNWATVVAFSPAIHTAVTTFRATFILNTLALLAGLAVLRSQDAGLLLAAALVLVAYLFVQYRRDLERAFRPATVFADLGKLVRGLKAQIEDGTIWRSEEDRTREVPEPRDGGEGPSREPALLLAYLLNSGLGFAAERLREVAASRKLDLYFALSLTRTFCVTVLAFGLTFLAIEKAQPGSFTSSRPLGVAAFVGLSFCTMMTADLTDIRPAAPVAQVACYLELLTTVLIVILLVFIILTSTRERHKEDLDAAIGELASAQGLVVRQLGVRYQLTLNDVESLLLKSDAALVNTVRRWQGLGQLQPPSLPNQACEGAPVTKDKV